MTTRRNSVEREGRPAFGNPLGKSIVLISNENEVPSPPYLNNAHRSVGLHCCRQAGRQCKAGGEKNTCNMIG